MPTLQERWQAIWTDLNIDSQTTQPLLEKLLSAYSQPHRHYHTLQHLSECLSHLDQLLSSTQYPTRIALAIWFHDAVYDPVHPADNEQDSADWAVQELTQLGLDQDTIQHVHNLIMVTKNHNPDPADADAIVMVDCDLAILGAEPERWREYEGQVRKEYAHVSDEDFRVGRKRVLEKFLVQVRIFGSKRFQEMFEERARKNLRGVVEALGDGDPTA